MTKPPSPSIRRRIALLLLLLLAGAVMNVAVAWGCVAWVPIQLNTESSNEIRDGSDLWAHAPFRQRFGPADMICWRDCGSTLGCDVLIADFARFDFGPPLDLSNPTAMSHAGSPIDEVRCIRIDSGWPVRAMNGFLWCLQTSKAPERNQLIGKRFYKGMVQGPSPSIDQIASLLPGANPLPLQPTWPGFAINTLFYALICWIVFCCPFVIRRWRRKRKGLCPACAYPVGESAVCTECGFSVRASIRISSCRRLERSTVRHDMPRMGGGM